MLAVGGGEKLVGGEAWLWDGGAEARYEFERPVSLSSRLVRAASVSARTAELAYLKSPPSQPARSAPAPTPSY